MVTEDGAVAVLALALSFVFSIWRTVTSDRELSGVAECSGSLLLHEKSGHCAHAS
jgi:hypothetical protein